MFINKYSLYEELYLEELEILERVSFPTTTPEETMSAVIDYFKKYKAELASIGVG